jgi:ribonuclease P protein component
MLPKASRIKKSDFPVLIKSGRGLNSSQFNLKWLPLADKSSPSQFSVIVAKKVAKTAVARNRLKRRLRYVLEKNFAKMEPGYQIAIFLWLNLLTTPFSTLEQDLLGILIKTKLSHA